MKKLLALDIGEVCVKLDQQAVMGELMNAGADLSLLMPILEELECGRITEDVFFADIATKLNRDAQYLRDWFGKIIDTEMPGMAKIIERITPDWNFVFLSDISTPHLTICRGKISFFERARGAVFSFQAGCRKPAAGMYEYFEKHYGMPDLYIDDRPQNIAAAIERGWPSRQFVSTADLEDYFNTLYN